MQLRCDDIFRNHLITNFPQNVSENFFGKLTNIWQRDGQKFAAYFLAHDKLSKTDGPDGHRLLC